MKKVAIISVLSLVLIAMGCAHKPLQQFQKISDGMHKSEVIEILGGPNQSIRNGNQDIWRYRFLRDREWVQREIVFQEDLVSYHGEQKKRRFQDLTKKNPRVWPKESFRSKAKELEESVKTGKVVLRGEEFISLEDYEKSQVK